MMANNYNWKNRYYENRGSDVTSLSRYVSLLGAKDGTGTQDNPLPPQAMSNSDTKPYMVLSNGNFAHSFDGHSYFLIGNGNTSLNGSTCRGPQVRLTDIIVENVTLPLRAECVRCQIRQPVTSGEFIQRCLLSAIVTAASPSNNSSINIPDMNLWSTHTNLGLISDCGVTITQASLTTLHNHYTGFDNCRFKIGNEMSFTALTGATEADLRQCFVDRCLAQGITPPKYSEFGEQDLYMYRWVFANNASSGGAVVRGSIIDKFQKRRFVQLGWKSETVEPIAITADATTVNALGVLSSSNIDVVDGAISHKATADITHELSDTVTSNIIWLGEGRQKVSAINILHNLSTQYGVLIDSVPSLTSVANGQIEAGEFYLARSTNTVLSTVTYNGVAYTSSVNDGNNIFVGVSGKPTWTSSGNEKVYKVKDLAVLGSIKMRIVDSFPAAKITSGTMEAGYWYFVEPKDLSNPAGSVTYNGKQYPCFASFLSTGGTITKVDATCHLRRCWKNEFDLSTETVDKSFWANIQKPLWFDVAPEDMRCLMKNNNPKNIEMQSAGNTYIASGYPGFYQMIDSTTGTPAPSYPIAGKYIQLQLVLSTLNPM